MPDLRERMLYPRAGWLSLGLLVVMALAVAWSVQGAGWLDQLEFLAPVAFWAILAGALLGMIGGTIVISLPLAAMVGTAVVLWTIGGEYFPLAGQGERLVALRTELIDWTAIVVQTGYPPQMSPYAIGLGCLMFATAFMAAFAVYRHHRVLHAIVLLGAAIITNMSATYTDLFGYLLLFVIAALLLWLRAALVERQDGWQRRRVNENLEVPAAIMRSGIAFAAASVALAWVLTSVAVAAPLTEAWRSFDGVWNGVRDQFEGVFGSLTNPQSRISGNAFGPGFVLQGEWFARDDEALVLAAPAPYYLRTATYDLYNGRGWERSDTTSRPVPAGQILFDRPTSERPTQLDSVDVLVITIEMRKTIGRNLFTAGSPMEIYAPAIVLEPGGDPLIGAIDHPRALGEGDTYQLQVAISKATEAELGAAGRNWPDEVEARYLDTTGVTDRVAELAEAITADGENDYQRAKLLAAYLRGDSSFTYSTRANQAPPGRDVVDYFLFDPEADRTGFCQYYASAMVMMARSIGLPARMAVGFAPGERTGDDTYLYRDANAHAWAEIYFPGYGWQIFEATKTIEPRFVRLPGEASNVPPQQLQGQDPLLDGETRRQIAERGGVVSLPSPGSFVEGAVDPRNPNAQITGGTDSRGGNALVLVLLVFGAGVVLWLRLRQQRRRWRLLPAGDRAWRQLTAAAERAGVGQRPSETIYEYAGWLEEQLPAHAEPIRTVADGKVMHAYSGRRISSTASQRLEAALAKLRIPLLGLAVRRWFGRLTRRDAAR